ncbi:Winged helix DNA-binding domain-containing protein [Actinokineospora alba]|uniref:Winged helix DNA-binding domain-containing protein n=1 Tax=Actinokineospora alba TaxID=504798 RepID=A0A1H0FGM4_9PSEU|nr:winged helix DNA-binding domain-containing protein [Actinokineospora alba]TDP69474.1 winged helix DNA-binding protein [Actinokineospora alba]SDI15946.1 Winged helix DNA-binding domain-containing protein [Actinokineospora alba]SDN93807.1 Winged helix DNA-binding domain-containing protein [Actinokineospora alba]
MDVDRTRVLAYRIAAHGLHRDTERGADLRVLDLGIQDAGASSPRVAMAARLPGGADLDDPALGTVWTFRGAPHVVRRAEVAGMAARLWPRSDADAIARLSGAGVVFKKAGIPGLTAFTAGAEAMRAVVDREKTRGEVSTEVTARLPAEYSYDCRTCQATHVYGSLFQLVGLAAGVEVHGQSRPTTLSPLPGRHRVPKKTAGAGPLITAYLQLHGPAGKAEAAAFLETIRAEAAAMWPDGLSEVTVDGRTAYLPEDALAALRDAPDPRLVRLLPPFDPLLQARDRDLLVPDAGRRKELWRPIGNPGAVLADGEIVGAWRTKATARKITITVTPFQRLIKTVTAAIEAEAEHVARARGVADAVVGFA